MEEKQLSELKYHFCHALSRNATSNKNIVDNVWDGIVKEFSDRPYHNLELCYSDLNSARDLHLHIPDTVVLATVLSHYRYNPRLPKNAEASARYISYFLKEPFDFKGEKIAEISELILKTGKSFSIPKPNESHAIKLMYDMRMCRLAKNEGSFMASRAKARREFSHLNDRDFYKNERILLLCYNSSPELFSLKSYQAFTAQVRDNISRRLILVNSRLGIESMKQES